MVPDRPDRFAGLVAGAGGFLVVAQPADPAGRFDAAGKANHETLVEKDTKDKARTC